jgi:uncharacterized protein
MALVDTRFYEDDPDLGQHVGQYTPPPPVRLQRGGFVKLAVAALAALGSAGALAFALMATPLDRQSGGNTVIAVGESPNDEKADVGYIAGPGVLPDILEDTKLQEREAAREVAMLADLALPPKPKPTVVDLSKTNMGLAHSAPAIDEATGLPEMQDVQELVEFSAPDDKGLAPSSGGGQFEALTVTSQPDDFGVPLHTPMPRRKPDFQAQPAKSSDLASGGQEPSGSTSNEQREKLEKSEASFKSAVSKANQTRTEPVKLKPAAAHRSGRVALNPAPYAAITKNSPNGLLPIVGPNGQTSREHYKRPFAAEDNRPRISLVVGGLGLSQKATAAAIDRLPGEVTLAFAPYGKNLQTWINKARAAGHEVLLELPMEPFDYPSNDPGPFTLLTNNDVAQNTQRLDWLLAQFNGYIGVTNYLGAKFTSTPEALLPILRELDARGLMMLDDGSSNRTQVPSLSKRLQVPYAKASNTIDLHASRAAIDDKLLDLEGAAQRKGSAIAMGYAYPVTIDRIVKWAATLEEKGFVLAPVSANVTAPPTDRSFDQHASNY